MSDALLDSLDPLIGTLRERGYTASWARSSATV